MALLNLMRKVKLLFIYSLVFMSTAVYSLTPAGTKIFNKAEMQYIDSETGRVVTILSNIIALKVLPSRGVNLYPDEEKQINVAPNSYLSVPLIVENIGNVDDKYNVELLNKPGDSGDLSSHNSDFIKLYFDTNKNGLLDSGEVELPKDENGKYITPEMIPGEQIYLVYNVQIPSIAQFDDFFNIETIATSKSDPNKKDSNITKIVISNKAQINLSLDSAVQCDKPVASNNIIDYKVKYINVGVFPPENSEKPYRVFVGNGNGGYDEFYHSGVLTTLEIPSNVSLVTDKSYNKPSSGTPNFLPKTAILDNSVFSGGIVVVGLLKSETSSKSDHDLDWYDYGSWDGKGLVHKIGFLVSASNMENNESGFFTYSLKVNNITGAKPFKIYNQASLNLDADGGSTIQSNQRCNTLSGLTSNQRDLENAKTGIQFEELTQSIKDSVRSGNKTFISIDNSDLFPNTDYYLLKESFESSEFDFSPFADGKYASIFYPQANEDPLKRDVIGPASSNFKVELTSSSDSRPLMWLFVETGPNTGLFRAAIPVTAMIHSDDYSRSHVDHCSEVHTSGWLNSWLENDHTEKEFLSNINNKLNLTGHGLNGNTAQECKIEAYPNDKLIVALYDKNGNFIFADTAFLSPQMTIFDATNLNGISGVEVNFYRTVDGNAPNAKNRVPNVDGLTPTNTIISDYDGKIIFPKLAPSVENYYISVKTPDTHVWPSSYKDPSLFFTYNVKEQSYGPFGHSDKANAGLFSHKLIDTNGTNLVFDVPIDPANLDKRLTVQKEADKDTAEIGSFVKYTVTLRNNLDASTLYNSVIYDALPYGFKYIKGSARLNETKITDPVRSDQNVLTFTIGKLQARNDAETKGVYTLTYILQLTAGAMDSDGVNSVYAQASLLGKPTEPITSNIAKFKVKISQTGVMSARGIIFGKVYVDAKCNTLRANQEWPIGGVKIYLETGDYVITDENGQYSLFGVKPGNHVVKVDRQTLPKGITLMPLDTRNAGAGDSRFADVHRGEMHRADFAAPCPKDNQFEVFEELRGRNKNINGDWLLDTVEKFRGMNSPSSNLAKNNTSSSKIVSGPSNIGMNDLSSPSQSDTSGYSLEYRKGSLATVQKTYEALPKVVQEEGYIYESQEVAYLRFGFSQSVDQLMDLKKSLAVNRISTEAVEVFYSSIPNAAKNNIDNKIDDSIPLPLKVAEKITNEEGKEGTWYWPKDNYSYDGRFIVVVRGGVEPHLYINGDKVNSDKLGEQILNKKANAQIMGWYGIELESGENLVEVKAKDNFGNERVLATKTVVKPESAKRISVVAQESIIQSDGGRSSIPINISLYDEYGNLARGTNFITLNSDKRISWLEPDIQPTETGYQVRVTNGQKTVYLRSGEETGKLTIQAALDDVADTVEVYQVAAKRPLMVAGILDYTARYSNFSGREPTQQADGYKDDSYTHDERGAIFVKGNIVGGLHLTLSYDSEKTDEEYLREISPDSYYPLAGDASIKGYDARSSSKLFAKIEKERHFLMWGDFNSGDGADRYDLGRTSQVLNGISAMYNDGSFMAQIYGAQPEDLHKVDFIDGNGTAMFYKIGTSDIVRHSDTVSLLTYDRNSPGLILEEVKLVRYIDYTIDYFSGDITFNRVIPTYDSALNPMRVRIAYDVEGNGDDYNVAGARLGYQFTPNFRTGISYEFNDNDIEGYKIGSVWAEYNFDSKTQFAVSYAMMDHEGAESADTLNDQNTVSTDRMKKGSAIRLSLKRDWNTKATTELEYARAEKGFTNTSASVSSGRQEIRLRHRQKLTGLMNLNIEGNLSESLETKDKQETVSVTIDTPILGSKWTTRLGSRYIKNTTETDSETYTTAIVGLGRSFTLMNKPARINTEYEQSFGHDEKRRVNVKADWKIHKQANLYTQYEYIDSLSGISNLGSGTTNMFTAGVDIDWLNGGRTFSEFRQRGATDGRSLELSNGYRGKFEVVPGISIDPAIEYVEVLKGEAEDGVAVSLGVADVRNPNYKTTGRIEYRHGESEDYYGLTGAWVTRLSQDWSGLIRDEYRYLNKESAENTWSNHFTMGLAYRPRLTNRYHMLGAYEWKTEHQEIQRDAHILSTHHNYKFSPEWTVSGRLGVKWEDFIEYDDNYNSITSIIDGRVNYYINRRWDVDLHAGLLSTDGFDSRRYSAGLGLNYLVYKNIRTGIGYNFIGFDDEDLDPQGYNLQGFYFNLMFKLDDDMFDWLSE
ncbi:hypothetical protein VAS14_14539 [Photobacterium angustum S14]|uniref:DUF11 domain-containing protein n=2 Tax=Photobacterium angustum TaxID=661 RepID=Q1ZU67_PHOAS|nr:hypothetical protein VAS14_14539 [Photobacterium angustum S14]